MEKEVVLEARNICKRFGTVLALNDISIQIHNKEIVAILGENGAGKSTLCKILTGLYRQDSGEIYFDGKRVSFKNANESLNAGIAMVYQERNLVPLLTGAQNIVIGAEKGAFVNDKRASTEATKIKNMLKVDVPLDVYVNELGAGEQQLIEIMRALYRNPKLLILDEPTASLGESEVKPFLEFVKKMKSEMDISIVFISHKLDEVEQIADRIIVFTDGEKKLDRICSEVNMDDCIKAMLRNAELATIVVPEKDFSKKDVLLKTFDGEYDGKQHKIDLTVHKGEVVGCYGLVGSGRTEWAEYLYGMRKAAKRSFIFDNKTITGCSPGEMIRRGMILTPEKRGNGIFKTFTLTENIGLLHYASFLSSKAGFVLKNKTSKFAEMVLNKYNVKYDRITQQINELSGGNIQKIIIGRSVESEQCKLLIADEPTNGMDIGAKHEVYLQLRRLADESDMGIVFISSELVELLNVCDRICVFSQGDVVADYDRKHFDRQMILRAAVCGRNEE